MKEFKRVLEGDKLALFPAYEREYYAKKMLELSRAYELAKHELSMNERIKVMRRLLKYQEMSK